MTFARRLRWILLPAIAAGLAAAPARAQSNSVPWTVLGHDPQHSAISRFTANPLNRVEWQTPVDQDPQYSGNDLRPRTAGEIAVNLGLAEAASVTRREPAVPPPPAPAAPPTGAPPPPPPPTGYGSTAGYASYAPPTAPPPPSEPAKRQLPSWLGIIVLFHLVARFQE